MKKLNTKGFTLAELLIVVAIIAVLVAISIPVFSSQLEKSREQTDIANIRAAKAMAVVGAMDWKVDVGGTLVSIGNSATKVYYYDAAKGTFATASKKSTVSPYGKGTTADGGCQAVALGTTTTTAVYSKGVDAQNKVLKCTFTKAGATYQLEWE